VAELENESPLHMPFEEYNFSEEEMDFTDFDDDSFSFE
jgi:hypothetical protein